MSASASASLRSILNLDEDSLQWITAAFTKPKRWIRIRQADRALPYSGSRRIIRANWAIAVTSWYTIPAKNGQNAPSNAMLYNCRSIAAIAENSEQEKNKSGDAIALCIW